MKVMQGAAEGVSPTPSTSSADMEIWKDIPGYEGRYQASSLGRIKSLSRKVRGKNPYTGKEFMRVIPERVLRPGRYCKSGHVSVILGHKATGKPVHRLVMLAFIGEPPNGMEVLHINGNPTDNRLRNLRYGTRTANILDVYLQGGRWRKLSIEDIVNIRSLLICGMRGCDIAQKFKVSQSAISGIKSGRSYWWLA